MPEKTIDVTVEVAALCEKLEISFGDVTAITVEKKVVRVRTADPVGGTDMIRIMKVIT